MPSHLLDRVKHQLDSFYLPFLQRALDLLADLEKDGFAYYITRDGGYRSSAEQMALWCKGRTTAGPKVTNAKGGFSAHNYGIAFDVCRDMDVVKDGLQPDWSEGGYGELKARGPEHGLQVGVPGLKDYGHIQLPLNDRLKRKEVDVFTELRALEKAGGLKAVWEKLDEWGPW